MPHSQGAEEMDSCSCAQFGGPLPGGGAPQDTFPRPGLVRSFLAALGRVSWPREALSFLLTGSSNQPKAFLGDCRVGLGREDGRSPGAVSHLCPEVHVAGGGGGTHTLTRVQPLFTGPRGKSERCWVDAGASTRLGWWKGARGWGAER